MSEKFCPDAGLDKMFNAFNEGLKEETEKGYDVLGELGASYEYSFSLAMAGMFIEDKELDQFTKQSLKAQVLVKHLELVIERIRVDRDNEGTKARKKKLFGFIPK